jgi:hypothetical protein
MDTLRMPRSQHRELSDPIKANVKLCIASYSQEQAANTLPGSVRRTATTALSRLCHSPWTLMPMPEANLKEFHRWLSSLLPAIDHSTVRYQELKCMGWQSIRFPFA